MNLKKLSAHVPILLAILQENTEGSYIDDIVVGYEELGIPTSIACTRNYVMRVRNLGFVESNNVREGSITRSLYKITKEGREELDWWRQAIGPIGR